QLFKRFLSYFSLKNEQLAPLVILYLLAHIFIWTFFNSLTHISPIKDNMEELVWASSLELGYYKHPPVPSWLMYFFTLIFGRSVWLTFFAGELCVAFALWFVWKLGCLITSQKNAFIAILLVS